MSRLLLKGFKKDPSSSQHGSIQKLSILMILAGLFIVLVVIIAWFALDRVKERIQADASDALQTVLQTTQESLNLWVESNKFQLTRLAADPRLVFLTSLQLRKPRNKKALLKSQTLQELRDFFRYGRDQFGQASYYIISPDLINIASMRDEKIGAKNLIANQALDLLNNAFQGNAVMVPPIWSDIPLITPLDGKNKKSAAMFFAAPIKNKQERVIAVITQRVDPSIDFTRLIQLGRIGKSGDTYAFGQYGKMLSESRFDEDLVRTGMIAEGESSILVVSARDPGGDMTRGFTPSVPRYQQPLTLMARQATKGKAGLNVEGYRDYRGVRVYGAWLWDDKLGIGLTSEIDEADALGPYYTTRMVILTVLGVTVLLALGSLAFVLMIDVRASRALRKSHDELELRVEERTAELKENQARLEQAEERSRLLLESADEGIFGVGEDGLVNFINPAGLAMLGFEAAELIGQKIHPLIHHTRPDGTPYPVEECPMYLSLTQGTIGNQDDEVLWRKDGTAFPVGYTSVPIRKNGSIAGTVVVFRDISERKEAEQALRKSRATARGLLDATQESLLLLDKEGIIIAVNQTAARRLKKTPEELAGTNRFDLLPQKIRESREAYFNKVLQTGNPVDFEDEREGIVYHNNYYPLRDKTDSIIGVAIFAQDITERKRAEEAVQKSEREYRALFENASVGILVGQDQKFRFVNPQMEKLLAYTQEELTSRSVTDFFHPDDREMIRERHEKRLKGESVPDVYNTRIVDRYGNTKWVEVKVVPIQWDDRPAALGFMADITERKRAEEELKRNVEELERFSKVAFGREKKMIQLKQEVNELIIQSGKVEKYKIVS